MDAKRFIYITAYIAKGDDAGMIAFQHTFVLARGEEEAYMLGMKTAKKLPKGAQFVNDYVAELPPG